MAEDPTQSDAAESSSAGMLIIICSVIVAFIGIVSALILTQFIPSRMKMVHSIECLNNLRQMSVSIHTYTSSNDQWLPSATTFPTMIAADGLPTACPAAESSTDDFGYLYLGDGLRLDQINDPGRTLILVDRIENHKDYVICAYADGHVNQIPRAATENDWESFRKSRISAGDLILAEPVDLTADTDSLTLPTYR